MITPTPARTRPRYPWPVWTDGVARTAIRGTDFWCTPEGFSARCYQVARDHGKRVYVHVNPDGSVYFRFYPDPDA